MSLGWTHVPAIVEDVSDALARQRALRDNAQWGEWEEDDLAAMLEQLRTDGVDLDFLGFEARELEQLLARIDRQKGDVDAIPPVPVEPVTRPGDLYILGNHRVLCGDATDPDHVAHLMAQQPSPRCIWTDPPYGVDYTGKTKDALKIQNDEAPDLSTLLRSAFGIASAYLRPGGAVYVAHPSGPNAVVFAEAFQENWNLRQTLVWVKNRIILGHSDYHYQHEPILFGYKAAPSGRYGRGGNGWYGENNASSVFMVDSPSASRDHPTAKPVELITQMLKNSTRIDDVVFDPFAGSGSTMIAADSLDRRAYCMEIDPRYVDVIVRRYEDYVGDEPGTYAPVRP